MLSGIPSPRAVTGIRGTTQCKDCSTALHREVQNLLVGERLVCLSGLLSRKHIVSEPPEGLNDFQREILVRV